MQKLELVVRADDWEKAKSVLSEVKITEKRRNNYTPINGLFIVAVTRDKSLDTEGYITINNHDSVAILSDTDSQVRAQEILKHICLVETQLRKLLLHVSDSIEAYFEILHTNSEYTRNFGGGFVTTKGKLDPITSHLTFGETVAILGHDISWSAKPLAGADLKELLSKSTNFDDFKTYLENKSTPTYVWDIIARDVLKSKISWDEISGNINGLKSFRNKSAHHHIISEKQKNMLIKRVESLLEKITPKRKLNSSELKTLQENSAQILKHYQSLIHNDAFQHQLGLIADLKTQLTLPSLQLARSIAEFQSPAIEVVRQLHLNTLANFDLYGPKDSENN